MEADELVKWRHAGELARDALQYGRKLIVDGADVLAAVTRIEDYVRRNDGGLAFPVNIATDEEAAHWTPSSARAGVRRGAGLGRRAGLADGGVARRVHGMGEPQRRSDAAARWVRHPGVERRLRGAGDAASQATVCGSAIPSRGRAFGIRCRIIPEFFEQSFGME